MVDILKLITPAESMDAQEARAFIEEHSEGSYTLLDVRQPGEYEESRIPGAKLIPLPQLTDSLDELDQSKPTIVYCAIGGRSRMAAQLLSGKGFEKVYNLKGGIKAWNGLKAEGPPDLGLELIAEDQTPEGIYKLAYGMESVMGDFYRAIANQTNDAPLADLLKRLAMIEDRHKDYLWQIYQSMKPTDRDSAELQAQANKSLMEGGLSIDEVLNRYSEYTKNRQDLLDLSMMLETQALDLYLRLGDSVTDETSKGLLRKIGDEEKGHLASLGRLREESVTKA
jgi:rhodanese-related sulfurtransferase/rubrerythrin